MAADRDDMGSLPRYEQPPTEAQIPLQYYEITYKSADGSEARMTLYTTVDPDGSDLEGEAYDEAYAYQLGRQIEEDEFVFGYISPERDLVIGVKVSRIVSIRQYPLPDTLR